MRRALLLAVLLLGLAALAVCSVEAASRSKDPSLGSDEPPRAAARTLQDLPPGWEAYTDQFIANLTRCHQIIGLSVSAVLANTSIYAKGFGVRSLQTLEPVDADTLFSIGSTTKAFTSTLLAMLIDEGYFAPLGWQTLVTTVDPSWTFVDSFMTDRATLADLLAMKSGLSIQPLMMFANQSRSDIIDNYQQVQPAWDFRTKFKYHNWMIALAGRLAEIATGQSWESLIESYILTPLAMKSSTPYLSQMASGSNWAHPYMPSPLGWSEVSQFAMQSFQNVAPAGSMSTTANDVPAWLMLHLNSGSIGNISLVSAATLGVTHTPQFIMDPVPSQAFKPRSRLDESTLGYGFGWCQFDSQGHLVVWHNGETFGYLTEMTVMPLDGFGLWASMTGGIDGELPLTLLRWFLAELLLPGMDSIVPQIICPAEGEDPASAPPSEWQVSRTARARALHAERSRPLSTKLPQLASLTDLTHPLLAAALGRPLAAFADDYVGSYANVIYQECTVAPFSTQDRALFPRTSASSPDYTLTLTWSTMTLALSPAASGLANSFDGTLSAPFNLVFGAFAAIPNAVLFATDAQGDVQGLTWVMADAERPPNFSKTSTTQKQ